MAKSPKRSQGTVLITGGAKRVGAAMALSLARAGYSIALHYNNSKTEAEKLSKYRKEILTGYDQSDVNEQIEEQD